MIERHPAVHIRASARAGTVYVSVTSNPIARARRHRTGGEGFAGRYGVTRPVRYELLETWRRDWPLNLIENGNPGWADLATGLGLPPLP